MNARQFSAFDFSDRVVWVTGAASGMGANHAKRFAMAGAAVACIDVNESALGQVVEQIRAEGGTAESFGADVTDWERMCTVAAEARRTFGPAHIVVANAGLEPPKEEYIEDINPQDWQIVLAVNLTGAFHTAKASIPQLREQGNGSLLFVGSTAALCGVPSNGAYVAAKHGVIGLMRGAATELGHDGIRVNAVCPGETDTPMIRRVAESVGLSHEQAIAGRIERNLLTRLITVDEISDAVLWLASDYATMVTGVALPVDAGFLANRSLGRK